MTKGQWVGIGAALTLMAGIVALFVLRSPATTGEFVLRPPGGATAGRSGETLFVRETGATSDTGQRTESTNRNAGTSPQDSAPTEIVVQVVGAVKHPGVYHLSATARNDDGVKAAGGLTSDANPASINLAAHAVDGSQIYIKTHKEQASGGAVDEIGSQTTIGAAPIIKYGGTATGPRRVARSGGSREGRSPKLKDPSEGKVNINTAPAEDLERIPNVGPSMAQKIITYRQENHGFKSVDDLMQVSGIGQKKFAKMAPFVKVH